MDYEYGLDLDKERGAKTTSSAEMPAAQGETMSPIKRYLTIFKVLWIIWVWEPFVAFLKKVWKANVGPCCDNPDVVFTEGPGITVSRCNNCRKSTFFTRAGF